MFVYLTEAFHTWHDGGRKCHPAPPRDGTIIFRREKVPACSRKG